MSEKSLYYYRTWFVVFMLILFFPAGFVLMWKGNKFGKVSRIVISVIGLSMLYPFVLRMKQLISPQKIYWKQTKWLMKRGIFGKSMEFRCQSTIGPVCRRAEVVTMSYVAVATLILVIIMVLSRVAIMRKKGIEAMKFGEMDKRDYFVIPFVLLYFYIILSTVIDL